MDILKIDTTNRRDVKRFLDFPFTLYKNIRQWVPPFEEFTDFIDLKDYRALEKEFLPKKRLEQKYETPVAG